MLNINGISWWDGIRQGCSNGPSKTFRVWVRSLLIQAESCYFSNLCIFVLTWLHYFISDLNTKKCLSRNVVQQESGGYVASQGNSQSTRSSTWPLIISCNGQDSMELICICERRRTVRTAVTFGYFWQHREGEDRKFLTDRKDSNTCSPVHHVKNFFLVTNLPLQTILLVR